MNAVAGVCCLILFAAGIVITKEYARVHPNSLMIERSPKADK